MKNSSEESNETSEEFFDAHVENKKYPRGDFRFSTWIFENRGSRKYRSVSEPSEPSEVSEVSEVSEWSECIRAIGTIGASSPYSGLLVKGRVEAFV